MSVRTEIDRLNAIKERIRTNLVAQGVTVPGDTMLDEMATHILSVAGEDGQRGAGLLPITTAPSSYTTTVNGLTPAYRIALSTVKSQASTEEVYAGDTIRYSYYHYPVIYVDSSYVYCRTRVSIRGASGAAGATGADGYTPVRGTDYWTEADKEEIVQSVLDVLGGAPFYGTVDGNNVITVTTSLADGTYILKYEHADGSTTEVGQIVISEGGSGGGGGVTYVDLADHTSSDWLTNKRINSSKNVVDVAESVRGDKTVVVTNFIDISGVSKLHIKGLDIVSNLSGTTNYGRVYLYQGTTVSEVTYQPSSGLASNGKIHYSTADYDSSVTVFDIATMLREWGKTSTTHVRLGGILTGAATDVIITADEKIQ